MIYSSRHAMSKHILNRKGSILIISLWSLCLLTSFAIILNGSIRSKLFLVNKLDERSKLRLIAEAGIDHARYIVMNEKEDKQYSCIHDEWAEDPVSFRENPIGDGFFSIVNVLDKRYGLTDEESKLNINNINKDILENLFMIVLDMNEVKAQELAASLVDWKDEDSNTSIPYGSAEDQDYRNLYNAYEAKDAPFERLDEILLVRGMTKEIYERIKYFITIYGDGKVNINTAREEVLLSLGLDQSVVDMIKLYRNGDDGESGTADDNVFDMPGQASITSKLSQYIGALSPSELSQLNSVSDLYLKTRSNNFKAVSIARLRGKKANYQVTAVVDEEGNIIYWNEP